MFRTAPAGGSVRQRRIRSTLLGALGLAAVLFPRPAPASQWEGRPVRLPPLFWYEADAVERQRFLMVSMLYWDYQEVDAGHRLLLPVFYRWREKDRRLLVSLPLLVTYRRPDEHWMVAGLFYRHGDEGKTQTALFPLYWQRIRREGGRTTVALPFVFYDYRNRDRTKLDQVSLLGWRSRRDEASSGMMLNYWWSRSEDSRFRTLFPFYWHTESLGQKFDVVGPFYFRREPASGGFVEAGAVRADESPVDSPGSRAPPSALPGRVNLGLFPVLGLGWRHGRLSSSYVFPLYYHSRSPMGRAWATLPASSFRSDDGHKGHLGLYFFSRDPDLRVDGLFPLWYRRRATDGFESTLQALNFYHRRENQDVFQTILPLYGYWSTPEGSRLLSWGVYRRASPDSSAGWAYLYFWKRAKPVETRATGPVEGYDRTRILFPLYWHFWREPDWGLDLILPVYARYRVGDTSITAVPPFVWRRQGDRLTWSFLLLYWRDAGPDRGFTTAAPFFHSQYDHDRRTFFSPLSWTRRSSLSREGIWLAPPMYWYKSAHARRLMVFPFYWQSRKAGRALTVLPPYYRWKRDERLSYGFFPLWGRHRSPEEKGGYLLPFYWYSRAQDGDGQWIVPLGLTYVSRHETGTEKERLHVQYLLLGSVHKEGRTFFSHEFFPLYKYVRQPGFANFWAPRVIALTAWEKRGDTRKGYVFPYLWRRGPDRDWDLFLPLWYSSRNYEVSGDTETGRSRGEYAGGASVFFPLYWAGRNPEREYRTFIPLYVHYGEENRRFTTVVPLWVAYDAATGGKFRLFFPLYWRFLLKGAPPSEKTAEAKPDRDIVVFGPWYRVETRRDGVKSKTVGLAPLFSFGKNGEGGRFWEVLGGLIGRERQDGRARYRILYFFYTNPGPES